MLHAPQWALLLCSSTQLLLQMLSVPGHCGTHFVPSQRTLPPAGAVHGEHELPHVAVAVFDAQIPLQSCEPTGQPHCPAKQVFPPLQALVQLPQ